MDRYVMELCVGNPVVVFSKSTCCMSYAIVMLIRSFGANPVVYELDSFPYDGYIEKALIKLGCGPSVPAVFIGGEFIGGSNEITSLNVRGKLKSLLITANAIWM